MSKNMVEPETPQAIRCIRVACWVSKTTRAQAYAHAYTRASTHTLTLVHLHTRTHQYVILVAVPLQQVFRERASLLRYTYIVLFVPSYFSTLYKGAVGASETVLNFDHTTRSHIPESIFVAPLHTALSQTFSPYSSRQKAHV